MNEMINELNYQSIKAEIKTKLNEAAESFVTIGYRLKQIRDNELYKEDGYEDIFEFAQAEYSLSKSNTSRFMAINDRYSIEGNSPKLIAEYEGYGSSKLSEMLTLSSEELKLITDRTTRVEIRGIKQMRNEEQENNPVAPAQQTAESLDSTQLEAVYGVDINYIIPEADKLIIEHFRDKSKRESLKELSKLLSNTIAGDDISIKAAEIINPSGHLMIKKGIAVLFLEEDHIKHNRLMGITTKFTYMDLVHDICKVFDMSSKDPWVEFYGEPEPDPIREPKKEPPKPITPPKKEEKPKTAIKEIEKKPVITQPKEDPVIEEDEEEALEDNIPGQKIIEDYLEYMPEGEKTKEETEEEAEVEVVEADIVINEPVCVEEIIKWHPMSEKPQSNGYVLLAILHHNIPDVIMGHYSSSGFKDDIHNNGTVYKYWTEKPKSPLRM